jgi:hypothetical protein
MHEQTGYQTSKSTHSVARPLRGTAANNRSNTVSYLEANAKFYNSDGSILTTNWTNVTDLAAGESWQFELDSLLTDRTGQVESGEILLTTESL